MIKVYLFGGLGNRYFQAMAGHYFADLYGKQLLLIESELTSQYEENSSYNGIKNLRIPFSLTTHSMRSSYIKLSLKLVSKFPFLKYFLGVFGIIVAVDPTDELSWISSLSNLRVMIGYFQTSKFALSLPVDQRQLGVVSEDIDWRSPRIAIHLRLGDYKDLSNPQGLLPVKYYASALEALNLSDEHEILVFSDEPELAAKILSKLESGHKFIPFNTNRKFELVDEVTILSQSETLICANSSFSLMAGIMNPDRDKTIVPSPFYANLDFNLEAWPKNWIRINY